MSLLVVVIIVIICLFLLVDCPLMETSVRIEVVIIIVRGIVDWRKLLHLHTGCGGQTSQILHDFHFQLVQIFLGILVLDVDFRNMQVEIGRKVVPVIIVWNLVADLCVQEHGSLICPAPGHGPYVVSSAPQHERWYAKTLHKLDAISMSDSREIEIAQPVSSERIRATLQNHSRGPEHLHDLPNDGLKHLLVGHVGNSVLERKIDGVILARPGTLVPYVARPREKHVTKFVKGHGHDAISDVECLLHSVAVVNINVDVQNPRKVLEELQNRKHDIVDVAESRGLRLLRVMKSTGPVDRYVCGARHELAHAVNRAGGILLAELVQAIKERTVASSPPNVELV
mmetsp:Transcript_4330/g.13090  ORF Transcript_4330/g.13090 Transcript_4330/m.13090 type:complete len:341 (+) Transcript_4330:459-1481(+)